MHEMNLAAWSRVHIKVEWIDAWLIRSNHKIPSANPPWRKTLISSTAKLLLTFAKKLEWLLNSSIPSSISPTMPFISIFQAIEEITPIRNWCKLFYLIYRHYHPQQQMNKDCTRKRLLWRRSREFLMKMWSHSDGTDYGQTFFLLLENEKTFFAFTPWWGNIFLFYCTRTRANGDFF